MRRTRRAVLALGAALAAFVALCPFGGVAVADRPAAAAYWMRTNPTSALPVAPNPIVPAGGLYVQQDPSSNVSTPSAYAGVRFTVTDGSPGVLTLKLAQAAPPGASVSACAIVSPWQAPPNGGPGSYDQAPVYDKDRCVVGQPSSDAAAFTFAVGPQQEVRAGVLDIAVVPTPDPAPPPFGLVFNAPDDSALRFGAPSSAAPATPIDDAASAVSPVPAGSVSLPPATSGIAPLAPLAAAEPAAVGTPPPSNEATISVQAAAPARTRSEPASVHERRWPRVMAVLLLMALAAALAFGAGQPVPMPHRLGRATAAHFVQTPRPVVAGIGRFARERSGPPNRLR